MRLAAALALLLAGAGFAEPLVLQHDELELKARVGLADANLHYAAGRLVIRGRSKQFGMWFPVRLETTFMRGIDGHVHLKVEQLLVSGRPLNSRKRQVQEKLDDLVNVKTDAVSVEVHDGEKVLFSQPLP